LSYCQIDKYGFTRFAPWIQLFFSVSVSLFSARIPSTLLTSTTSEMLLQSIHRCRIVARNAPVLPPVVLLVFLLSVSYVSTPLVFRRLSVVTVSAGAVTLLRMHTFFFPSSVADCKVRSTFSNLRIGGLFGQLQISAHPSPIRRITLCCPSPVLVPVLVPVFIPRLKTSLSTWLETHLNLVIHVD
jgi:hypothetical protein